MQPVETIRGDSPIVLGLPHTGTYVPDDIIAKLNPLGQTLADTDWHVDRLYKGLLADVTSVRATFHRYVIDANRDPSGASLYPGQNTTSLVPFTDFEGEKIWREEPDADEIERRRLAYHKPYHEALEAQLQRVKAKHGFAILYDCHSIRSRIAFLFDGKLPDFSIGTNEGRTCAPEIQSLTEQVCASADGYTSVSNGRFKGGWTTRHYGRPNENLHAIQMELTQSAYLKSETAPFEFDEDKAARLREPLGQILSGLSKLDLNLESAR